MPSIKIRTKRQNNVTQIRTLITHPMETGRNRDPDTGEYIPENFIQELTVKHNDKIVISCFMAAGISKNPFFSFLLNGGEPGDKISIAWIDNLGNRDVTETTLK